MKKILAILAAATAVTAESLVTFLIVLTKIVLAREQGTPIASSWGYQAMCVGP